MRRLSHPPRGVAVVQVTVQILLGIVLSAWVVRRDERRLSAPARARAWNDASFWSAIVAFGPLALPVHYARTRRSVVGFLLGLLVMMGVLVTISVVTTSIELLAG